MARPRGECVTEEALHGTLLVAWFVLAAMVFVSLFFVTAPYGRHTRAGWGPQIRSTVGWIVMETPSLAVFALCFALGSQAHGAAGIAFLVMWCGHYAYRALLYPALRRGGHKPMPLSVAAMGFVFNLGNAYLNGRWLYTLGPERTDAWLGDPRFLAGAALFALGFAAHVHSDRVLAQLRSDDASGYAIPSRGLHRWVASPNYLGETIQWLGFALATWSLPGLAFAVWTFANLAPRARSHLAWYRETFPDYPRERRAMVPFVF